MDNETLSLSGMDNEHSEETLSGDETTETTTETEGDAPTAKRRRFGFLDECHDDSGDDNDENNDTPTADDLAFLDDETVFDPPSPYVRLPLQQPTLEDTAVRHLNHAIANSKLRASGKKSN